MSYGDMFLWALTAFALWVSLTTLVLVAWNVTRVVSEDARRDEQRRKGA